MHLSWIDLKIVLIYVGTTSQFRRRVSGGRDESGEEPTSADG